MRNLEQKYSEFENENENDTLLNSSGVLLIKNFLFYLQVFLLKILELLSWLPNIIIKWIRIIQY